MHAPEKGYRQKERHTAAYRTDAYPFLAMQESVVFSCTVAQKERRSSANSSWPNLLSLRAQQLSMHLSLRYIPTRMPQTHA